MAYFWRYLVFVCCCGAFLQNVSAQYIINGTVTGSLTAPTGTIRGNVASPGWTVTVIVHGFAGRSASISLSTAFGAGPYSSGFTLTNGQSGFGMGGSMSTVGGTKTVAAGGSQSWTWTESQAFGASYKGGASGAHETKNVAGSISMPTISANEGATSRDQVVLTCLLAGSFDTSQGATASGSVSCSWDAAAVVVHMYLGGPPAEGREGLPKMLSLTGSIVSYTRGYTGTATLERNGVSTTLGTIGFGVPLMINISEQAKAGQTYVLKVDGVEVGRYVTPAEVTGNIVGTFPSVTIGNPGDYGPMPTPDPIANIPNPPNVPNDDPNISNGPTGGNGGTGTVGGGTGGVTNPGGGLFPGAGAGPTPDPDPGEGDGEAIDYGKLREAVKFGDLDAMKEDSGIDVGWGDPTLEGSKDGQVQDAADGIGDGLSDFGDKGQELANGFKGVFEKFKPSLSAPGTVSTISMPLPGGPLIIDLGNMPMRSAIRSVAGWSLVLFGIIAGTRLVGQLFVA